MKSFICGLIVPALFLGVGCTENNCPENSLVNDEAKYSVTLSFWESSELDDADDSIPTTEPRQTLEFTWDDSEECFVWIRTVNESIGGGERTNVASSFSLDASNTDEVVFTYTQNSSNCCNEFNTPGTEKTFYNHKLIEDESTSQTGNALRVAVTDYRVPQ